MKLTHTKFTPYVVGLIATAAFGGSAQAQSSDALIDKLVEKGILTVKEANDLRQEADKGFTEAYQAKSGLPDWVDSLKFNGDLRARYDGIYADDPLIEDRHRARYRVRFGTVAHLRDNFEVGVRLASSGSTGGDGGGDPVSTNETLGNNANRKSIGIDQVYAKWSPLHAADWTGSFTFGKMENPYVFSEMVFDQDYTPEGFAEQFAYVINPHHSAKLNLGQFILDEIAINSQDPFMLGAQLRLDSAWNTKLQSTVGAAGLGIVNARSLASGNVPNVGRGNTRNAAGELVNEYTSLILDASMTYQLERFPGYTGPFPIKLGGEYIRNFGADEDNEAFGIGPTFGKAGKKGLWEVSYKWKELQADAIYEETVDSDYGGFYAAKPLGEPDSASRGYPGYQSGTNVRGHVVRLSYSPLNSLTFTASYWITETIREFPAGSPREGSRLILDAVWKY